MRVYLFYEMYKGLLNPTIYAFTANKEKAKLFKRIRCGFYYKEKDITKSEYKEMKQIAGNQEIDFHSFQTSNNHRRFSVILPCTVSEIKDIILHKETLVLRELQKHVVNPEIFTEDLRQALYTLGFKEALMYQEAAIQYPYGYYDPTWDEEAQLGCNFEVDELGLFIILHKNTLSGEKVSKEELDEILEKCESNISSHF